MTKSPESDRKGVQFAMRTPPIVSPQAWEAARQQLLVKEKAQMRAHDALAAERRRMPWMAVEQAYAFEGPTGAASLLDLFEGRRQLIIYRAFFEPGVFGWPEHACRGCSLGADQVAHLAHLNVRDTTLAYASRAPQADIARLKTQWTTLVDVKNTFPATDHMTADRLVFDIGGNKWRIVARVDYQARMVFIRWIGDHRRTIKSTPRPSRRLPCSTCKSSEMMPRTRRRSPRLNALWIFRTARRPTRSGLSFWAS
jgi:mRNA-degrading endonuclease HigB of HigAB toxin-antitoxin module